MSGTIPTMRSSDSSPDDESFHDPLQSPPTHSAEATPSVEQKPMPAGLSENDFHRIQLQLLELRTLNCQLGEENKRYKREQLSLEERLKSAESIPKLSIGLGKMLPKSVKKEQEVVSEDEINSLRRKLHGQESEFRLQQATLMEELNRVIKRSDELEAQLAKGDSSIQSSNTNQAAQELIEKIEVLEVKNEEILKELERTKEEALTQNKTKDNELHIARNEIEQLLVELNKNKEAEETISMLAKEKESIQQRTETHKFETDEKVKNLKQEIASYQEKFRRKQESYVQLAREKESQYQEYRKSLDSMVEKKDAEINEKVKEIQDLKQQLKAIDEFHERENEWKAKKASMEDTINSLRASMSEVRDQNEALQIQLQETHSANDCISAQLEETRKEVLSMQEKTDSAFAAAEKRKILLDEMASHLEETEANGKLALQHAEERFQAEKEALEKKVESVKSLASNKVELEEEIEKLKNSEQELKSEVEALKLIKGKAEEEKNEILAQIRLKEEETERKLQKLTETHSAKIEKLEAKIKEEAENLRKDKDICMKSIGKLKQEVADKEDEIKLAEKKHSALMRDLKRQIQTEKKRADRTQEKVQELKAELTRNKSPGFEEIRASEVLESLGTRNPETGMELQPAGFVSFLALCFAFLINFTNTHRKIKPIFNEL